MELRHHHVIPRHIGRLRARQLEVEAAHQVPNCHVHFHVCETVHLSAKQATHMAAMGTHLIPRHDRLPREKATMNRLRRVTSAGACSQRSGSKRCGSLKMDSL